MKTVVVFRRYDKKNRQVVALFPEIPASEHRSECLSYRADIGHWSANYALVMVNTRPATPEEYTPLQIALENKGYDLQVIDKATADHRLKRYAEIEMIKRGLNSG